MGIMEKCLRLLMPRGRPWALAGHGDALIAGLGVALERPRVDARAVLTEARPGTAVLMLPEWSEALGIRYDSTLPVADLQDRLAAIDTALADMTLNDLQEQINKELAGVTISEVSAASECGVAECGVELCGAVAGDYSPTYYDVDGEVMTEGQLARLVSILQHFAPLHLQACIIVGVEGLSSISEAGVAVCGLDECGNDGT